MEAGAHPSQPQAVREARPHATRSLLVLCTAGLAYAMGQTMLFPALPELITVFDTDAGAVAWTFTAYLLSAAVLTPVFGRLGDMFGKRRILVITLALFAAGNVVSALAGSLGVVVAGRVVQGAAVGVFPLAFAIIRDEFPPDRVRPSIGLISATVGIGSGVGLVAGGLLVDHASYHWIFWLGAFMGILSGVAAWALIPESPERRPARVDVRGAAVMALGLVLPLIAISQAQNWGWTGARTLGLVAAGLAVLAGWVALERRTPEPLANIATLSRPPVLVTNIVTVLIGFGMFGAFVLVPQLVQAPESTGYGFGVTATVAGLLLVPGALMMLVAGPVSGLIGTAVGSRFPLALGGLITAMGMGLLAVAHTSQLEVMLWTAVTFTGIGLGYAAMPNLIIDAVPPGETGEATGFNTVMRIIGASLGGQVCATILAGSASGAAAYPSDSGFETAFLVGGGMALVGAVMALFIPVAGGPRVEHLDALGEIGAAASLGEIPYVPD